jgi:DNA mismatch repair protein MutS
MLQELAEYEILWRIACSPILTASEVIISGGPPLIEATMVSDISLGSKAVPSTVSLTRKSHHAALTGPNGGGKSSFLRAVLQCVLLSHSYGVAPAQKFKIRKISWISSGLRLQDNPGSFSMFESEVLFASNILRRSTAEGIGMVLYDELFHSTNPPDGIRTAEKFLKELWTRPNIVSIVSTHVFELVETAPESVQRLCCSATEGRDDTSLSFLYDVKPGICKISSVKSIWKRFGLSSAGKPRSKKQVKKEKQIP